MKKDQAVLLSQVKELTGKKDGVATIYNTQVKKYNEESSILPSCDKVIKPDSQVINLINIGRAVEDVKETSKLISINSISLGEKEKVFKLVSTNIESLAPRIGKRDKVRVLCEAVRGNNESKSKLIAAISDSESSLSSFDKAVEKVVS